MWFEDVDFCRRLVSKGWKIIFCPESVFIHSGGHSVNQLSFHDRQQNLLRYFAKHHTRRETTILRFGIIAGLVLRALFTLAGVKPKAVNTGEALRSYTQALWRYGLGAGKDQKADKKQKVESFVS